MQYMRLGYPVGEARFSPGTRWVAFDSCETGRSEVYVQSFPDPGVRRQISVGGGTRPRWTSGGREIVYLAPTGDMMVSRVRDMTATFDAEPPRALFSIPHADLPEFDYDVAPDGQRFLITTVTRPPVRSPIIVVMNWSSTLAK